MTFMIDKSSWSRAKFGDVVENTNRTIRNPIESGIDKFIGLEHLDSGDLKIKRWGETADGVTFTKLVSPGQTLFGKRRVYQKKAAFVEFSAVCSGDILAFSARPDLLSKEFLPFVVTSEGFFNRALSTSAGSLSPRTRWPDLAKFEFLLPPLEDQEKLAKLFWALEEYKNVLELQLSQLSLTVQSFTTAWKASHLHEMKHLSEMVDMYQPKTIMKHELIANGKYEVHGANNLLGHYDKFNHSGKTIAIACRGATCGSVNVILGDVWITGNAMVIAPKDPSDLNYFVELLPTIDFKRAISGSAQPQITRSSLETLSIPFPKPESRLQFEKKMRLFREAKLAISEELSLFEDLLVSLKSELIVTI